MKGMGSNFPGFFAEYVTAPENLTFSVEGLDRDVAVFSEPAACAMHGLERLEIRPGSSALVIGAGPTGLLLAQLIASGGATSVTVAAPRQFKLDAALRLGVDGVVLIDRADPAANVEACARPRRTARDTTSSSRRPGHPRSAAPASR